MAMPFIQMALMPEVGGKDRQRIILTMMINIFDDVLGIKYGTLDDKNVKYPAATNQMHQAATDWTSQQLMTILDDLLAMNSSMTVNVNFQNIVESVTLKILKVAKS
ncbi:hypothetical protein [Lentilactobacillus kisonensis]|nr:hypothetical protein [Lentilactobacillus kisonensis]